MHQHPAPVWNAIAEMQPLQTDWAEQMFPMPQEALDVAMDQEQTRLAGEMGSDRLAMAYLAVMPTLWEAPAVQAFKASGHYLSDGVTVMETVQQAVIAASRDYSLTTREQAQLEKKLRQMPAA